MKKINEQKLQAFSLGSMGKRPQSRKEIEDQKKREEELLAANAFKEFVETFQEAPAASSKVWVKAGTYDAGSRKEDYREKGKLYKPGKGEEKSATQKAQDYVKMLELDSKKEILNPKRKAQEKKKSNLELFKEELRQIQEEREERHKYKHQAKQQVVTTHHLAPEPETPTRHDGGGAESGSFDNGDPNTTNLYLGNLSPKISEQQLMEIFGRYGPLASIKIMWPRSEEERSRGRNCGFVAYMSRKDAERALKALHGRDIHGYEMRLGWGKSVPILNHPIYIPPALLELTMPPPPSNLPFNAQPINMEESKSLPDSNYKTYYNDPDMKEKMEDVLERSVVKVIVPTEKSMLAIIHRMIEFVIREGPMFEALVMSREMENPLFRFLFDNESPTHIYYRWKLYSLLQGDTATEWNEKPFRMFQNGPIWKPPAANFYTQGMPEDLVVDNDALESMKGALSSAQRDRFEDLIRHLTPERAKIADVMIFCIEHAEAADEICECIAESLSNPETQLSKKIARFYLISDILHNCTVKVSNASFFRRAIEKQLEDIAESLNVSLSSMESRLKSEGFKSRVLQVFRAWEEWAVYPKDLLYKLKSTFLGKPYLEKKEEPEDIDGAPLSGDEKDDEDLDGVPLDGAALLKSAMLRGLSEQAPKTPTTTRIDSIISNYDDDDIDGVPLDDDIDGIPIDSKDLKGFIPSKWETIDPQQVQAQAITTSKWDTLEPPEAPKFYNSDDDSDSNPDQSRNINEDRRSKLRDIEVRTMKYQDELESGEKDLKSGWSINEQVEHYRRKLLTTRKRSVSPPESIKKNKRSKASPTSSHSSRSSPARSGRKRSRSPKESSRSRRNKSRSLSVSPKREKYKERSPVYVKSSRSPSPPSSRGRRDLSPRVSTSRGASPPTRKHKHKHRH
ncbi:U2SURP family protein [Megaselia abdita]